MKLNAEEEKRKKKKEPKLASLGGSVVLFPPRQEYENQRRIMRWYSNIRKVE